MKTLLILNTGTGNNLGDRAMLLNVVRQLRAADPEAVLRVSADVPEWLCREFNLLTAPQLRHIWGRWSVVERKLPLPASVKRLLETLFCAFLTGVCAVLSLLPRRLLNRLNFMEAKFASSLRGLDLVYFSGGGYLTDVGGGGDEARALLVTGWLANLLGARLVLTGQGIGPLRSADTCRLVRQVVRRATLLSLRDPLETPRQLRALGIADRFWQVGVDDAFSLPLEPLATLPQAAERRILAVSFRRSSFHEAHDQSEQVVSRLMAAYLAESYQIWFFVLHERDNAELEQYRRWCAELPAGATQIIQDPDPRLLFSRLAQCHRAIGTTYHFALFALAAGLPLIALSQSRYYRSKFSGLSETFDRLACQMSAAECQDIDPQEVLESMDQEHYRNGLREAYQRSIRQCDQQLARVQSLL